LEYVTAAPSPQHALDIFKGEWASALPAPWGDAYKAGHLPLFADTALLWALPLLGGVRDRRVLELGPLEGLHTYLLRQQGAASITAIEANPRAYLRCLVIKEITGLTGVQFLHGDFVAFLREHRDARFDIVVASGVLYHMEDPAELLGLLAGVSDTLYLWTHYFDAELVRRTPNIEARFKKPESRTTMGFQHVVYPYQYAHERFLGTFYGGPKQYANWITRDDIVRALRHFGFHDINVGHEEEMHIHGPAFAIVARKTAG
jgi:2-polyprenyl-3-methyl-5-hydroxy-6-metoxy-1,4-benzoquinol methylase